MATLPVDERDELIPLPDPAAARRGARRAVLAGIVVVTLLTNFTAGGTAMVAAGEIPGLPLAVGGATAQLAVVALLVGVLRARSGGSAHGVSRSRLASAGRIYNGIRVALLFVLPMLAVYALVRAASGDPWTLLTAGLMALPLWLLLRGTQRLRRGVRDALRPVVADMS